MDVKKRIPSASEQQKGETGSDIDGKASRASTARIALKSALKA